MSAHSYTRRLPLASLLFILFAALVIPSLSPARDPHPRKVRIKNDNSNLTWATPLVYGSLYGTQLINELNAGERQQYCPPGEAPEGWKCDCNCKPNGPISEWVRIERGSNQCYAPPYTKTGPWWDWLVSEMENKKNTLADSLDQIPAIGVYLGIDGEGRPLKSDDGWRTYYTHSDMTQDFSSNYVPAVIDKIQELYKGKTIRAHTDSNGKDLFLEEGIDFHRESLAADEVHAYLYEIGQRSTLGWWQGFADHFWVTNSLGLGQGWPPIYITTLSALSKHTDSMTGGLQEGQLGITKEFIKFTKSYIGRDIHDTPGVWIHLRDTMIRKKEWHVDLRNPSGVGCTDPHYYESKAENYSGKYGDYDFYLYRPEELEGNHTEPVKADDLPWGLEDQIYSWGRGTNNYGTTYWAPVGCNITKIVTKYVGRKVADGSRYMSFDIDDGYVARFSGQPGVSYDFRIVYLDQGLDAFKLQYKNEDGEWQEKPVTKTNTNLWKEFSINVTDAVLNNSASEGTNAALYPTDFRLDFGAVPTVIHLIEVRGKGGMAKEENRKKAQIAVDLIRNKEDEPKNGIYSVGRNQTFWVKATLKGPQGNRIRNARIMFAYNTEWNLAKSAITDDRGEAYVSFSTANNPNSSGFLAGGGSQNVATFYSIQAYFPGSENYQPSRNDAKLWVTESPSPTDSRNLRMEITNVFSIQPDGKVKVDYKLYNPNGNLIYTGQATIGKKEGFYADDLNAQTISLMGQAEGYFATSNHVTLYGNRNGVPDKVKDVKVSSEQGQRHVTLSWKANTESDIAGYRVFYGRESGNYTNVRGVGKTTSATISDLFRGKVYYFSVRAHNEKAYEGGYSAEVSKKVGQENILTIVKSGSGTGRIAGTGINCGSGGGDCWEVYPFETSVNLSATPNAGSVFGGWGGACTGTNNCPLHMNSDKEVIALFNEAPTLTIAASVIGNGGGTINPSGSVTVIRGANKTFTMVPNNGYYIYYVKVDGTSRGSIPSYTFGNVTSNHTIAVQFRPLPPNRYTLTVSKTGTGDGTVDQNPSGSIFAAGTVVTLTAAPEEDSVFAGWSGACTGTSSSCSVPINSNVSVAASFTLKAATYTITSTAGANGSISPQGNVTVNAGGSQTFAITPNNGYKVAEVVVDDASVGAPTSYTFNHLTSNHRIAATFNLLPANQYSLAVNKAGSGNGSVDQNPSGNAFSAGTGVTLTARPDEDSLFSGWSGACTGSASICTVTVNSNLTVTATFTLKNSNRNRDTKKGIFDMNGDGKADILWRHQTRGDVYVWYMDGGTFVQDQHIATVSDDLSWKVVGVGDFNGDGKPDILWHHQQRGEVYVWFMDGSTFLGDQHIRTVGDDLNWKIVGVEDYNGDGKADILWHHQRRGDVYVWFMDGPTFLGDQHIRTVGDDLNWKIVGAGDFSGDGKADILWHHQRRGDVYVWFMDGTTFLSDQYIRTVQEIEWQIEATGDYNGDGKTDILWRNQRTGEVYVWFMDGATFVRDQFIRTVEDTDWKIVN